MTTNTITITVTTTVGSETRTNKHEINGETRREAMTACKLYVKEFASKLADNGWNVVPITKIDFSATKTIATPQGDVSVNTLFEARWDTRKNKLVPSTTEGFRSLTVGVARKEKAKDSEVVTGVTTSTAESVISALVPA